MEGYFDCTANYLYPTDSKDDLCKPPFEYVPYTSSQRKIKVAITLGLTLLSIAVLAADWYSCLFFRTKFVPILLDEDPARTIGNVYIALCCANTVLVVGEMVAFIRQFRDIRTHSSPMPGSELLEEVMSALLLLVQNLGVAVLFFVGFLLDMCSIQAHIRYYPMRIVFILSALSVCWRVVQSFAYCSKCKNTHMRESQLCCHILRFYRIAVQIMALGIILYLLCVSFSLRLQLNYSERTGRTTGSNTNNIYIYQRIATPYTTRQNNCTQTQCAYLELRTAVGLSTDIASTATYVTKLACRVLSPFYFTLIPVEHRNLLDTHECKMTVGIGNLPLPYGYSRVVNVGYELTNERTSDCVSGQVHVILDTKYDPSVNSVLMTNGDVWTDDFISMISNHRCDVDNTSSVGSSAIFIDCLYTGDATTKVTGSCDSRSTNDSPLAMVSGLLISEKEMKLYFPCMSAVNTDVGLDLQKCRNFNGTGDLTDGRRTEISLCSQGGFL